MDARTKGPSERSRRIRRWIAVIGVMAMIPAAPALSQAGPATPPEIDTTLQLVVGEPVGMATIGNEPGGPRYGGVLAELHIEMTNIADGTWEVVQGPPGTDVASGAVLFPELVTTLTYEQGLSSYDGTYGGGSTVLQNFYIAATNPGTPPATTEVFPSAGLTIYDEDGSDLAQNWADLDIVLRGRWRNSYCDCWLGGTVLRTTQRWARMTASFDVAQDQVVGIVMPMAPNRGEAKIKLDGVNQGRVDLYAPTSENRIVMWQTPPLDAGTHTIQIINMATEGRRRIDIDAFVVIGGYVGG